jgi:hypothetical protein
MNKLSHVQLSVVVSVGTIYRFSDFASPPRVLLSLHHGFHFLIIDKGIIVLVVGVEDLAFF